MGTKYICFLWLICLASILWLDQPQEDKRDRGEGLPPQQLVRQQGDWLDLISCPQAVAAESSWDIDKGQQKVRFLTISVPQTSACKVWWRGTWWESLSCVSTFRLAWGNIFVASSIECRGSAYGKWVLCFFIDLFLPQLAHVFVVFWLLGHFS